MPDERTIEQRLLALEWQTTALTTAVAQIDRTVRQHQAMLDQLRGFGAEEEEDE